MNHFYYLLSTPTPAIQIKGNEWVIALIILSVLIMLGIILYFAVLARLLKKANNGFPKLIKKEQEQSKLK